MPEAEAESGSLGSTSPSTTGWKTTGSNAWIAVTGSSSHWPATLSEAATSCPGEAESSPSPVGATPASDAILEVTAAATSAVKKALGTLWVMALRNSPHASSMAIRQAIDPAPAECPATVTLPGSPPNAAMFSRTQRRAAT